MTHSRQNESNKAIPCSWDAEGVGTVSTRIGRYVRQRPRTCTNVHPSCCQICCQTRTGPGVVVTPRPAFTFKNWCRGRESNPHGRYAQRFLRPSRLIRTCDRSSTTWTRGSLSVGAGRQVEAVAVSSTYRPTRSATHDFPEACFLFGDHPIRSAVRTNLMGVIVYMRSG